MPPYQTLYIYEVQGRFPNPKEIFSDNFIGCWHEADYSFLFFSSQKTQEVQKRVSFLPGLRYCSETILDYKNWETGRDFGPLQIGQFFLYPFWDEVPVPQNLIPIKLNPGVVFGSGCHPSTKKCLENIDMIFRSEKQKTVLDLGCGTGILSVAAAKLGAKKVLAIDSNNLAVETTRENIFLNHVESTVEIIEGDAFNWVAYDADLVIANLDFRTIERLIHTPAFFNKEWYVLSGMVRTEVNTIKAKLKYTPLFIYKTDQENFWFTIIGKNSPLSDFPS